ncbi:MAG TPA: hypothetical protein VEX13_02265 [Chloroflexia bacterium]|nr:hypothetical protein [Chloroflexia bacterium]
MSKAPIWDQYNPLFFYRNPEKLDDLIERAYGEIVTEVQQATKGGTKGTLSLTAKFGGFLTTLGLIDAGGQIGTEFTKEDARTKIVSVTYITKLNALIDYCRANEKLAYIDAYRGSVLSWNDKTSPFKWDGRPLISKDKVDAVGYVRGLYTLRRVIPPHDDTASLAKEIVDGEKGGLWQFTGLAGSVQPSEIPFLSRRITGGSQHAIIAFHNFSQSYFHIEALGLLTWKDSVLVCDPIACRLFH